MIVVHFESGLGNQMLNYAEYLAVKKSHPNEAIYFENIIYELNDSQDKISMWNGYELEHVFNIKMPNVSELFSKEEWIKIIEEVRESKFWKEDWAFSEAICEVMKRHGIKLKNMAAHKCKKSKISTFRNCFYKTRIGYFLKRSLSNYYPQIVLKKKSDPNALYLTNETNFYTGQKMLFLYKGNDIEIIKDDLIRDFQFPSIPKGSKNFKVLNQIKNCNSIALHIRRSDMLYANGYLYKYGYFKRAIKKIRGKIENPVFFVFGDTDSIKWVAENYKKTGLNSTDKIVYINWNKGGESYRDMQLMTYCKGVIFTNSSFGWWGAFLNQVKNKITISPFANYNTTDWV